MQKVILDIPSSIRFDDNELYAFCAANRNLQIERNEAGQIILMPPAGGVSSHHNSELGAELVLWNRLTRLGYSFDPSGGFLLPSGAMRTPDAAWVSRERWEALTEAEKEGFPPLCPDFVIELRSSSDSLPELQAKMEEWLAAGCRLAWLLDPRAKTAWVYRPGQPAEETTGPLSGESVLPGFVLNAGGWW